MTRTSRTCLRSVVLAVTLAVGGACASTSDDYSGFLPIEVPIVLKGAAPDYEREAIIERLAGDADMAAILQMYRLDQEATRRLVEYPYLNVRWWLVIPPAQSSGGWRLQVTWSDGDADACLLPPRGAATAAFVKSAYLVGLPPNVGMLHWQPACP